MKFAIHAVDGHRFPNLALMRIASWHKAQGHAVEWFNPLFKYDRVYASKIFTFTPDDPYLPPDALKGGTGYDVHSRLPDEIAVMPPDYSFYPGVSDAYGFLTRGCPNNCPWCVVPAKEGNIHPVADISDILRERRSAVLMDNNFLSAPEGFVSGQLTTIADRRIPVDFNQALDARRVPKYADLLARVKWAKYLRLACDTDDMIGPCADAVGALRRRNLPGDIMVYVLARNGANGMRSALRRIHALQDMDRRVIPFVMPFRSLADNSVLPDEDVKALARWCNRVWIRKSCDFETYKRNPKKGEQNT